MKWFERTFTYMDLALFDADVGAALHQCLQNGFIGLCRKNIQSFYHDISRNGTGNQQKSAAAPVAFYMKMKRRMSDFLWRFRFLKIKGFVVVVDRNRQAKLL